MKLHHKIYGSGEVVVILHGLFGMSDNWKTLARKLSEHYSVVLIDLPNHGRSPRLEKFTLHAAAEALHEFLTDNWMYEIRLVGHSLGGKVAMTFAQLYPDMVEKLVSIDIGPKAYHHGHEMIFKALRSVDVASTDSRKKVTSHLEEYIDDGPTILFLSKNLKRTETGFRWKFDLDTLHRDYDNFLIEMSQTDQFEEPTLFVKGGDSNYIHIEKDVELMNSIFPNSEIKTIANAGHWLHADQPEALESMLIEFFAE